MASVRIALIPFLLLASALDAQVQPPPPVDEDYGVYTDHPRLFLNSRRLRLLQRERERASLRWQQFDSLLAGKAQMPEPGFSLALYHRVSGKTEFGKRAVEWALSPGAEEDLRQMSIVFDWCQDVLGEQQSRQLADRIRKALAASAGKSIADERDRTLAAVVLAGHGQGDSEKRLAATVGNWWRGDLAPRLRTGKATIPREHLYAFVELLHAVADNLKIDLREDAARYFKQLPAILLLTYYPPSLPAAENDYRIPEYAGDGEPDLRVAMLSRGAELALVAYDTNAQELQFLQGWLINDRFLMRGPYGIPYEFLWANPYQPGLSYFHLPLHLRDSIAGRLLIRSSWEENAVWFSYDRGKVQMFADGSRKEMSGRAAKPLHIGGVTILFGASSMKFEIATGEEEEVAYVINLKPDTAFDVEVDDEELAEYRTDPGGVLQIEFPKNTRTGVRLKQRP